MIYKQKEVIIKNRNIKPAVATYYNLGDYVYRSSIAKPGVIIDIVLADVKRDNYPLVQDLELYEIMFKENEPIVYCDARWGHAINDYDKRVNELREKIKKYEDKYKDLNYLREKFVS